MSETLTHDELLRLAEFDGWTSLEWHAPHPACDDELRGTSPDGFTDQAFIIDEATAVRLVEKACREFGLTCEHYTSIIGGEIHHDIIFEADGVLGDSSVAEVTGPNTFALAAARAVLGVLARKDGEA